jgi:hypothetical protein
VTYLCAFCLEDDGQERPAVTFLNGCAVCAFHVDRAAGLVRYSHEVEVAS